MVGVATSREETVMQAEAMGVLLARKHGSPPKEVSLVVFSRLTTAALQRAVCGALPVTYHN